MMTKTAYNTPKKDIRISGFLAGLSSAFIGTAIFSVIKTQRPDSLSLSDGFIIYGFMFSAVPAGIGGIALGWFLQNKMCKGSLTLGDSVKAGMISGGVAASITCAFGILFLQFYPHNYWAHLVYDVLDGTIFTSLPNYLRNYWELAARFAPEILIAILIACLAGGLTGAVLSKPLLSAKGLEG